MVGVCEGLVVGRRGAVYFWEGWGIKGTEEMG